MKKNSRNDARSLHRKVGERVRKNRRSFVHVPSVITRLWNSSHFPLSSSFRDLKWIRVCFCFARVELTEGTRGRDVCQNKGLFE